MKNIGVFLSENFQFLEVKFSIYLNRRVFVISNTDSDFHSFMYYFVSRATLSIVFDLSAADGKSAVWQP